MCTQIMLENDPDRMSYSSKYLNLTNEIISTMYKKIFGKYSKHKQC